MKVLILGAAGQIGRIVVNDQLEQTDFDFSYTEGMCPRVWLK